MNARDDVKEEIKNRLEIEDIVGRHVELKRSGASFKGLCPFHQEKTPSFYVTPRLGTYKCFGCGRGGDIFSFVMEMEHVQFPDALRRLAEQANVRLPERLPNKPSLKGRLHEANDAALSFYREELRTPEGRRAAQYLFERGFGEDAIQMFELGYAPRSGEGLIRRLHQSGFEDRILLAAGLASERGEGGRLRDQFYGRLMFPIRDVSGKISGFGGRIIGDGLPKYVNSPQTEVFDKSSALFGIHRSADAIKQAGRAVLVEGYLDAIRAHLSGFDNTVASLGTAVTPSQLTALSRLTETVILALDPDNAGQNAAARTGLSSLIEVTQRRGSGSSRRNLDLRIVRLPDNSGDPDELIREHPEVWQRVLDDSIPTFDFVFERTLESLDHSAGSWREEAVEQLLPLIQQLTSPVRQALWVQRLSTEVGIDVRQLIRAMPSGVSGQRRRTRFTTPRDDVVSQTTARGLAADPALEVEEGLISFLLQLLVIPADAAEALQDVELGQPEHGAILQRLLAWQNYDYEPFRDGLPEGVREVADELRHRRTPLPPSSKISIAVRLYVARLRHTRVQAQLDEARRHLEDMELTDQLALTESLRDLENEKTTSQDQLQRLQQLALQAGSFIPQGTIDQESGSW